MGELIPNITLTDFRKLVRDQVLLKQVKTCEVFADGVYLGTWVEPQTDYIRVQTEYIGQLGNSVGGVSHEELLKESHAAV